MKETKEVKKATVEEMEQCIHTLLRENVVGIAERLENEGIKFSLAGGQSFLICVKPL
jgi:hypothetical protein